MTNHSPSQRVLLADRDADVRRALTLLLQTSLGLDVVAEAPDLIGISANGYDHTDLLLIDWVSVSIAEAGFIARLRSLNTRLKIIVLSTRPEDHRAAIASGADAFISKVDPPEQVLQVVRSVLGEPSGRDGAA
ncbi:MAG: response regulator transcription factor [Oscillochloris sp.]|nr:response regulator transcription factor [Oscillochloris sp.]